MDGLNLAIKTLRTREDSDGRIIGFTPYALVVPAGLEATARQVVYSQSLSRVATGDQLPEGNPIANMNIRLVVEPRLDVESTSWYLFSIPLHGAVLLATLNGRLGVRVEQADQPANMLGMVWRAWMDHGCSLGEFRACVKSTPSG